MADDKNIQKFSAADIEKYHKGLLTPSQMHAMEKAALDDPFLADALEGYGLAGLNISADIAALKERFEERTSTKKVIPITSGGRSGIPWLRIAAIIVVVLGAGTLFYVFNSKDQASKNEIAKNEIAGSDKQPPSSQIPQTDSGNGAGLSHQQLLDSNSLNIQAPPVVVKINDKRANKDTKEQPGTELQYTTVDNPGLATKTVQPTIIPPGDVAGIKKEVANPAPTNSAPIARARTAEGISAKPSSRMDDEVATYKLDSSANLLGINEKQRRFNANAAKMNEMGYQYNMNVFRGRVTDINNNGIPFANVTNVQDNVGTYTDARGFFNLTSPDSTLNVQTRALGFNNYNVQLRNGTNDNRVVMQEDRNVASQTLSERKVNYEQRVRNPNFKFEGEPEPEDGWDTYDNYLANNVNIPQEFKSRQTEATQSQTVEVTFEVNKSGEPYNFKVIKSLCAKCDEEAIRLIKEGPKWKRKNKKGRAKVTIAF